MLQLENAAKEAQPSLTKSAVQVQIYDAS